MAAKTMVAKRYAKAFAETFEDLSKAEVQTVELEQFCQLLTANEGLAGLLKSPAFEASEKWTVLEEVLTKANSSSELKDFLRVLVDADRLAALYEVSVEFKQIVYAKLGYAEAIIESAYALTESELLTIKKSLEITTGKKLKVLTEINSAMIAGLKVTVDGKTFDGSLGSHLGRLQKTLLQAEA